MRPYRGEERSASLRVCYATLRIVCFASLRIIYIKNVTRALGCLIPILVPLQYIIAVLHKNALLHENAPLHNPSEANQNKYIMRSVAEQTLRSEA